MLGLSLVFLEACRFANQLATLDREDNIMVFLSPKITPFSTARAVGKPNLRASGKTCEGR
jgi:hypothetical protein